MTAIRSPVTAWRLFTVNGGLLRPPFADWYWADVTGPGDAWVDGQNRARCLVAEHRVPFEGCGCGVYAVRDLPELLAQARAQSLRESPRSVLEDCGVLARVILGGFILPSNDPADPSSSVKASLGRVCELWLSPDHEQHAEALRETYKAPVTVTDCWDEADPERRLWPALRRTPFGNVDRNTPAVQSALTKIAHDLAAGLRGEMTRSDAARALFDSAARPTWLQATAFVSTVVDVLAPEVASDMDGFLAAQPPTWLDNLQRGAAQLASGLP